MSKRKVVWTMDQHRKNGLELKKIHEFLTRMIVEVSHSYPNTVGRSSKVIKETSRATEALSVVRSELESIMYADHPDEATLGIYYGGLPDQE